MKSTFIPLLLLLSLILPAQDREALKPYATTIPGSKIQFHMQPIPGGKLTVRGVSGGKQIEKTVTISPFWVGRYEVTHDEFDLFLKDEKIPQNSGLDAVTRPSPQYIDLTWGMGREGGFPANSMQQLTALMYCRWLYEKTGIFYRLPTEAEWQYAALANTAPPKQAEIDLFAWHKNNSDGHYQKVGQKKPNAFGLYDMLGNVAEWTLDEYREDYIANITEKDPLIEPDKPLVRTLRGGSFESEPKDISPFTRTSWKPAWNKRDPQIPKSKWWLTDGVFTGFRLVRPYKQPTKQEANEFFTRHIQS